MDRTVFTIGFTRKSAEVFFGRLRAAGVSRVIDVRLNNTSQLAGFSKRDDLKYLLKQILGISYVAEPLLAPTPGMLNEYRAGKGSWAGYEQRFLQLLAERRVEDHVDQSLLEGGCLLCSEDKPHQCHRRVVAEYLQSRWGNFRIEHL